MVTGISRWLWYAVGRCYRVLRPLHRQNISPADVRSLLIVRPDYLGDTLLFLPKLREIRRALPSARIDYAASKGVRELLERTGWVDHVLDMDAKEIETVPPRHLCATIQRLRQNRYDLVIGTSLANFYTGLILAATRAKCVAGYAAGYNQFVYTKTFTYDVTRPIYRQDWEFVEWFGGIVDPRLVPYPATENEISYIEYWLKDQKVKTGGFAVLHHTAFAKNKKWSSNYWRELALRLRIAYGIDVVFTGTGLPDGDLTDEHGWVHDTTGELTLGQLAALMERALLVVSVDTGPLHMAVAARVPTVGLYAVQATRDRWGYGPEFNHAVGVVADSSDDNGMNVSVETVMNSVRLALSGRTV